LSNHNLNKYLYILSRINKLGNIRIRNIINLYDNYDEFIELNKVKLCKIEGIEDKISELIISEKNNFRIYSDDFDRLSEKLMKLGIKLINIFNEEYPNNLKKIFDAPVLLYFKGNLNKQDNYAISVVGTRNPTDYGKKVCEKLVSEISALKIPIISGLARGIDSIAHINALRKGNLTYAVLGCGVDVIYPSENDRLYKEIYKTGAIISEFEPGTKPDKNNFPKRNRIISGISLGTVVIETGMKGGSLITAGFALDQNKEVFAVPGNIYSKYSEGTNDLIKKGQAKLILNVDDILNELDYKIKDIIKKKDKDSGDLNISFNIFEKTIYECLDSEPMHIDTINEKTGLSISDCLVNLLSLEFKGVVKQLPGKYFVRNI
jgi:DNA processing protein